MSDFTAPKPDFASSDKKTHPSRPEDRGSTIHLSLYLFIMACSTFLAVHQYYLYGVYRTLDLTSK